MADPFFPFFNSAHQQHKKDVAKNEGVRIRTEHDEEDVLKRVSKNEEVIITYDNCCCFSAPFTATFFNFFSPAWRRRKVMMMGPKKT